MRQKYIIQDKNLFTIFHILPYILPYQYSQQQIYPMPIILNKIYFLMRKPESILQPQSYFSQEKQKRFTRKNNLSKSPRTVSNKTNNDSSLSKFWVKNLNASASEANIQKLLINGNHKNLETTKISKVHQTHFVQVKGTSEYQYYLKRENKKKFQQKQIKEQKSQIQKFQAYIEKQNQKLFNINKRNQQLQKNIKNFKDKNQMLDKQVQSFKNSLIQKDIILQIYKKQQSNSGLRKVKANIFQNRVIELQKQNQLLKKQITSLQKLLNIQRLKCFNLQQKNQQINRISAIKTNSQEDKEKLKYELILQQLYQSKQKINKLQFVQDFLKRKHFQQLQMVKEKYEKQYEQLKKKFVQLLQKYKRSIKKITVSQINELKRKQRKNSKDSIDSLALSSEQEKFQVIYFKG